MNALRFALVFAVAALCGLLVEAPVFVMSFVVMPTMIFWPLAVGACAVGSALGAGWASNFLSPDRSWTRLFPVVGAGAAVAAFICVISLVILFVPPEYDPTLRYSAFYNLAAVAVVISLATTFAARKFRSSERRMLRDIGVSFAMILAIPVAMVGAVFVQGSMACDAEERAAFDEFEQYGGREMEAEGNLEPDSCFVDYSTRDSVDEASEYFLERFEAHGWNIERKYRTTSDGSIDISATRGDLHYEVGLYAIQERDPHPLESGTDISVNVSGE